MAIGSPLTYFGSKSRLAARIIAHFPPHHTYVEPFAGSGVCLLSKEPSRVEVFNDINGEVVNLFRVIRNPAQFQRLRAAAEATLYSRSEFELAFRQSKDPVERARRFLVRQRQSRTGLGERWSYCKADSAVKMASAVRRWRAGIDRLPAIHQRLKTVQIEQADWRVILDRYDSDGALFYLDPPYPSSVRISGGYDHEMSLRDHRDLVHRVLKLKGKVVLSGYANPIYRPLEIAGWAKRFLDVPAYSSDRRTRREECLWISPVAVKRPKEPTGSPAERMRAGAYATHRARVSQTEAKIRAVIGDLRDRSEPVNITLVAAIVGMTREHLSKKYNYLFTAKGRELCPGVPWLSGRA